MPKQTAKERPILFNGPMVYALRERRKTQTRRVVKGVGDDNWLKGASNHVVHATDHCPLGKIGDQLWVREKTWVDKDTKQFKWYVNQDVFKVDRIRDNVKIQPSIFMKRKFSRIQLKITDVRVERLQDISQEDALAEGIKAISKDGTTIKYGIPDRDGLPGNDDHGWPWQEWETSPIAAYKKLWESINGQNSWHLNPWVWVIEFERVDRNGEPYNA